MSTAAIVGGSLAGAGISAGTSMAAAGEQSDAAKNTARLQFQLGQENLGFQEQQYANTLGLLEPQYLTGIESLGSLAGLLGLTPQSANTNIFTHPFGASGAPQLPSNIPGVGPVSAAGGSPAAAGGASSMMMGPQSLQSVIANGQPATSTVPNGGTPGMSGSTVPGTNLPPGFLTQLFNNGQPFETPTLEQAQQSPGFQFNLKTGEQALENSAAAKGNILSGNEGQALEQFSQGLAENTYNDVYNRALNNFQTNYNAFNTNQNNIFNRFATLAGMGQTSAGQLAGAGVQSASNIGNVLSNLGGQIGNDITNAGAARASGYVGAGNAFSSVPGNLTNLYLLNQILNNGSGGSSAGSNSGWGVI